MESSCHVAQWSIGWSGAPVTRNSWYHVGKGCFSSIQRSLLVALRLLSLATLMPDRACLWVPVEEQLSLKICDTPSS